VNLINAREMAWYVWLFEDEFEGAGGEEYD